MGSITNLIVGLTGGMGCGKSTAAAMFAERGFRLLDADQTLRDEIYPTAAVSDAIRARFGPDVIAADGTIHRGRLGEIVFKDSAALAWLEDLLHPLLLARWREIFSGASGTAFIVEVPLLFEKGLENWFDFIVCVTAGSAQQLRRLEQRGISPDIALQRLAKQLPLARKCDLADHVLLNDGSTDFLREQVNALADRLLKNQSERPPGQFHGSPA
ncbi:MAG TPA: dephospho-CoA kinase [Lacunisphaera sp.]|jgi:dephospho-CoA kinase|nr:dephospho-CoA kinase [Lacunisphaera sp.]